MKQGQPGANLAPEPSDALLARYEVAGPRYTSYPTAPEWKPEFKAADLGAALERASVRAEAPLSLYVHLPFCFSLCWYCGCNMVVGKDRSVADVYLDHLAIELELVAQRLGARRQLTQVHFGGGTPTYLDLKQLERLWTEITSRFQVAPEAEVAIELHPARTTKDQVSLLRSFGFNRVSMGLQDFDTKVQEATNRLQSVEQTRDLLEHARSLGFGGVNFDLIYGLPHQTSESWARTLDQVLSLAPDRLAVYSFAHVPDILKHQKRMPAEAMPKGRSKLELFRTAYRTFLARGYQPIGMDHFALPSDELARAQSQRRLGRNFQGYTVTQAAEVIAVGTSAISDVGGVYAQNVKNLTRYYGRLRDRQLPTERGMMLTEDDVRRRGLITQLMCNFWADLGEDGERRYANELERLGLLESDGLVERRGTQLTVTPVGRLFVRNVAMIFDAYLTAQSQKRFSRTV